MFLGVIIKMKNKTEYFAGANTKNGYVSCFNEIIDDKYKKVYILKGSAGSGKSTFMKRVGERALREGKSVEYIRCSADTTSFDGILIPESSLAIVDGTAPHLMDVKYPSVRESIINLGAFWDDEKLKERRRELMSLIDRKKERYDQAFRILSAAGSIRELRSSLISGVTLDEKMKSFAERMCKKLLKSSGGSESIRIQTAFNGNGLDSLPTFSDAGSVYLIRDKFDIAHKFLKLIKRYAEKVDAQRIISYDPIDLSRPEAIYFPQEDLLFVSEHNYVRLENSACVNKPINMSRFIDKEGFKTIRQKARASYKLYDLLLETASQYFKEARRIHENIERIYIRSMDFARLTDYTNKFLQEIFG